MPMRPPYPGRHHCWNDTSGLINISRQCQPYMLCQWSGYRAKQLTVHSYSLILHYTCLMSALHCLFSLLLSHRCMHSVTLNSHIHSPSSCHYFRSAFLILFFKTHYVHVGPSGSMVRQPQKEGRIQGTAIPQRLLQQYFNNHLTFHCPLHSWPRREWLQGCNQWEELDY